MRGGGQRGCTVSGTNAVCMHSKSQVEADLGKPGMKSVGRIGCALLPSSSRVGGGGGGCVVLWLAASIE